MKEGNGRTITKQSKREQSRKLQEKINYKTNKEQLLLRFNMKKKNKLSME
jgi:hypothetical protein